MAALFTNPAYQHRFIELGLTTPDAFLDLQGVIFSGHPDRHVRQVTLDSRSGPLHAFLKREHRVRWRDRFATGWRGFGSVSKSLFEWNMLRKLAEFGISCPEALAAGESRDGKAFLLVHQVRDARDLREHLAQALPDGDREALAGQLGEAIA